MLIAAFAFHAEGQNTRRRNLRSRKPAKTEVQKPDTIAADSSSFTVFGYEKTLRSTSESFFVTNTTTDTITAITGVIEYIGMDGRQLHKRDFHVPVSFPPGETRQISLPSWDRQKVWYYHLSPVPRSGTRATPYSIRLSVSSYIKQP